MDWCPSPPGAVYTSDTKEVDTERVAAGRTEDEATHQGHAGHVLKAQPGWLLDEKIVLRELGALHLLAHPHGRHSAARPLQAFVFLALILWLGLRTFARRAALTAAQALFATLPPS